MAGHLHVGLTADGSQAVALKGLVKMVSCVLARSKTKPRGEKTINTATMLRLLKSKAAVFKRRLWLPLHTTGGHTAATPSA